MTCKMLTLETENETLKDRLLKLERSDEVRQREVRRKNVTIRGLEANENNAEKVVREFLCSQLKIESNIEEIIPIRMDGKIGMFIVKFSNITTKFQAINNKRNLRGSQIFISQDRTLAEREIQRKIAKIAKDEEQDGNQVKIGFKKLMINERHYIWKEGKRLVESFRHEANGAQSRPAVEACY